MVQGIAYYFQYYGQLARGNGQDFIAEVVAPDLATLGRRTWETGAPCRQKRLEPFRTYDTQMAEPLAGVKKAQARLAGYFLLVGEAEAAARIRATCNHLDPEFVRGLADDLRHIRR